MLLFSFLGNSTRGYIGSPSLFYWWGFQWVNPGSETQHGLLILAISGWLLWRNLRRPANGAHPGGRASWGSAAAMLGGLAVHSAGFVAEQARVSILGLILFAWGLAWFSGGDRWARASAFPLAYLLFAIPVNALDSAGFWLRMGVVAASARIAHAVGIGVLVNGTQLLSPDGRYNYDVAAACSGVRSLMALGALSLLIGYLRFTRKWLVLLLCAASIPLVFIGNVARIVSIVVAAQLGGKSWGDTLHEWMGFGVFVVVLGGAYVLAEAIASAMPGWTTGRAPAGGGDGEGRAERGMARRGGWPAAACVAAAAVAAALLLRHVELMPASFRSGIVLQADGRNPVDLPAFIGSDWIGQRTDVTPVEREVLPPDTGYSRKIYVSLLDPAKRVLLSIVLSGRDRTSIHRPEYCLVGQGWTIRGSFPHRFRGAAGGSDFPATVLRIQRAVMTPQGKVVVPQLFAYYFVGATTVVATHWERIGRDALERLFRGESDRWAYVILQTDASDGEANAVRRLQSILDGTLARFQKVEKG